MKILGVDYGLARVGTAISYGSLAEPLMILPNDAQLFANLNRLVNEHAAAQIVVGLSEAKMADQTRDFVAKWQTFLSLPIVFVDETLTSYQVQQYLRDAPAAKRRGPIDHYAAALILQTFLDDLATNTDF